MCTPSQWLQTFTHTKLMLLTFFQKDIKTHSYEYKICQTCGLSRDLQIFSVTLHPSHLKNVLTAMEYLEGYWGSIPQWTRTQQLWSTSAEVGGVTPNKRDPVKENWNTLRRENTLGKRIKFHVMRKTDHNHILYILSFL